VVEVLEVEELYYFLVLLSRSEVEERVVSRTENWSLVQAMEEEEEVVAVEAGHDLILLDSPLLGNRHLKIVQGVVLVPVVH